MSKQIKGKDANWIKPIKKILSKKKYIKNTEIKPKSWPKKISRTHKVERQFIAYQDYLVGP